MSRSLSIVLQCCIHSACRLTDAKRGAVNERLENRIAALVNNLPPLDNSVERLLNAAIGGTVNPADIRSIVAADPGLCTNLLFLANCSCYNPAGQPGSIETVREALDAVSLEALSTMAGASAALNTVSHGAGISQRLWNEYLQHSREVSAISAILAGICGMKERGCETYAVAGLTHDVGRIVIMAAAQDSTASFLGTTPSDMARIVESEQAAFRMDHCQIGHALFSKWGFSEMLCHGILRHHTPIIGDDFCRAGAIVFVSHFITMSDFTGSIIARMLPATILHSLSLQPRDLDQARKLYTEAQIAPSP